MLQEYYSMLKAHLVAQGADLPGFVEREFEGYLKRGRRKQFPAGRAATPVITSTWWHSEFTFIFVSQFKVRILLPTGCLQRTIGFCPDLRQCRAKTDAEHADAT